MIFTGLVDSLVMLFLMRALAGFFGGSVTPAQAYVADVTLPAERARHLGYVGAAIGLGFALGPAVGAVMADLGFAATAFAAAGLTAANFLFALVVLPESHRPADRVRTARQTTADRLTEGSRRARIQYVLMAIFFAMVAFSALHGTYALLAAGQHGLTGRGLALIFTIMGVIVVVIQGGLIGRLVTWFGEKLLAAVGAACMAAGLFALPLAPNIQISAALVCTIAAGWSLTDPMLRALLSRSAGSDRQGRVLGLGQSLTAAGRAIGPIAAGAMFDVAATLPYAAAGAIALAVAALVARAPAIADGSQAIEIVDINEETEAAIIDPDRIPFR